MIKQYERDCENCEYLKLIYEEYDTGYKEYDCEFCFGSGCPFKFKYEVVKDE